MTYLMRKFLLPFRDSERIVEAANEDRQVHITQVSNYLSLGFSEFTIEYNSRGDYAQINPDTLAPLTTSFILPAGQEIWGAHSRTDEDGAPIPVSISLIITRAS